MNAFVDFMKRNYKIIVVLVALSVTLFAFKDSKKPDPGKDKMLLEFLTFVINKGHYDPKAIDDNFSKGVYKNFIKALDPSKRFFLKSDIEEFAKYEVLIDDEIKNQDLTFFEVTHKRLLKRIEESKAYYKEILSQPIDYTIEESTDTNFDKLSYAETPLDLKGRWYKQIKLSTLSSIVDKLKMQEDLKNGTYEEEKDKKETTKKAKEKLDKENEALKEKSFDEIEKETRENTKKSLDEYFTFTNELDREDYFGEFINVIAENFDPHTNYFPPSEKEKFDVTMSGKFFGIGAVLQRKNDYTEITSLISGGPAWRQKELEVGDVILKVAQGNDPPVDVVGMKLDEVVKKIKGPKGTDVRLTVKKGTDGSIKVIKIMRDEVEIEETYAKSSVVNKNGKLYGVIYLPKFYIDFENKDSRDAAKDIAIEVDRLKRQGVEGIALDVRDDGGGSLRTVVDIVGLFIDKGPVVQVKSAGKEKEVLSDNDGKTLWNGPLVIMINNASASASEILAAAIQDYRRGVIIGSKQSYGKGTVQNFIDLNQFVKNNSLGDLGAVKTTIQKFYRINGGSTQLKGVSSDVVIPDRFSYVDIGERDMDNAMPWDKIDPAKYMLKGISNFDLIIQRSKKRLGESAQFNLINENAKWLSKRKDQTVYSLNLKKYREEQSQFDLESKKFKAITEYKNDLKFTSTTEELAQMEKDTVLKEKRERWHEILAKDAYVEEALNILQDLQPNKPVKKIAAKM
jgi:carboxyl-terminal processing protease